MKGIFVRMSATFWKLIGICNSKGCYKRATTNVIISNIKVKRCLCDKHLLELQKQDLFNFIHSK